MPKILIEQRNDYLTSDIQKNHLASLYLLGGEGADNIMDFILYSEKRFTFTMLVSGGYKNPSVTRGAIPTNMGESLTVSTRIPKIENGTRTRKEIKYMIKGRDRRSVSVLGTSAFGTPTLASATVGGFFSVVLGTKEIRPNSVVSFPTSKTARVHGEPRRNTSGNGYIYTFQTFAGESFVWDTWMGSGASNKKVYSSYNTVGESSRKGYMSWLLPDTYINHSTTMRKGLNLSGDALTESGAYKYVLNTPDNKNSFEGYSWVQETNMRQAFNQDLDNWAWEGKSTMRDEFGNLLTQPSMVDEKNDPIWAGDGVKEQIRGSNDVTFSGEDGLPSWQDYEDLVITSRDRREPGDTTDSVIVTGPRGADHILKLYITETKITINLNAQLQTGANTDLPYMRTEKIQIGGEIVYVVVDPRMGDTERWSGRLANGGLAKEYEAYMLNFGNVDGKQNIAMEAVNNKFVNRDLVIGKYNGMTGMKGQTAMNSVDEFAMDVLGERATIVRTARHCGLLEPDAASVQY